MKSKLWNGRRAETKIAASGQHSTTFINNLWNSVVVNAFTSSNVILVFNKFELDLINHDFNLKLST